MARLQKTATGQLNIALHPHSPDVYESFLRTIFKLKRAVKIRGERYGVISVLERSVDSGLLMGIITTFTYVDRSSKWFDFGELKVATSEKTEAISIPEGMFPNPKAFRFYFDVQKHILYFQNYTEGDVLTPKSAERIFKQLSEDARVVDVFGLAKISIKQSKRGLTRLFSIPQINEIRIVVLRPNPDVFSSKFDERIANHLEETKSRRLELIYRAEPGQSIKPDDDIRMVGEYAIGTGEVAVRGRDANGAVSESSRQYPDIINDKFDPNEESDTQAFRRVVERKRRQS